MKINRVMTAATVTIATNEKVVVVLIMRDGSGRSPTISKMHYM